jgi:Mitochondrial small ribosomal subunit Rsm22
MMLTLMSCHSSDGNIHKLRRESLRTHCAWRALRHIHPPVGVHHAVAQCVELMVRGHLQVLAAERGSAEPAGAGVHVVAPCPHDGGCPMDGTSSWCHFAQRFQRTALQKNTKMLAGAPHVPAELLRWPGAALSPAACSISSSHEHRQPARFATWAGGRRPRDYQDERFSYVVLQRSERPEVPTDAYLTARGVEAASAPEPIEQEFLEADSIEQVGYRLECCWAPSAATNPAAFLQPSSQRLNDTLVPSADSTQHCRVIRCLWKPDPADAVPSMQLRMSGCSHCTAGRQQHGLQLVASSRQCMILEGGCACRAQRCKASSRMRRLCDSSWSQYGVVRMTRMRMRTRMRTRCSR